MMGLLGLSYSCLKAQQNLVPNPSFEEYNTCPIDAGETANYWTSPTLGTPDYFNTCAIGNFSVPNNMLGTQSAFTGNAYAGFGAYTPYEYLEYLQVPLIQPLLAGHKYHVSFYISLVDKSRYAIKEIGALFSTMEINTGMGDPLLFVPHVEFSDSIITDTVGWTNIQGSFIAHGDERYLIIGNFHSPQNTTIAEVNDINNNVSYYYLDDVSVTEISVPLEMPTAFSPNVDNKNDTYYPTFFDTLLTVREFRIYNRWGQLIHDNPTIEWDGNYNGNPQPPDVYTYYIYADIPLPDNPNERTTLKKQGSFTLLR